MITLLLTVALLACTILWPLNRWVLKPGARSEVYGFWGCLSGGLLSGCLALVLGTSPFRADIWKMGVLIGAAFAGGYWTLVMYCLRTGPIGPTVAVNNMGLVWPVAAGLLWLDPHPLGPWLIGGFTLICLSLASLGLSRSPGREGTARERHSVKVRWILAALGAWVLAGVSMAGQLAVSLRNPGGGNVPGSIGHAAAVGFAYMIVAALLLAPVAARGSALVRRPRERIGGLLSGVALVAASSAILTALQYAGPEVVFAVTIGGPVVITTVLGRVLYKERLDRFGWLACGLAAIGIVALGVGQSLVVR